MTETKTKTRTITLTGRAPVAIREDAWPEIAKGWAVDYDGSDESPTKTFKVYIRVRQHADTRAIVYGRYEYHSAWQGERRRDERAGVLVPAGGDIPAAITTVADALMEQVGAAEAMICRVARECVAQLPAEHL